MRFRTTVFLWLLVSLAAPALSAPPEAKPTWMFFTQEGCGPCITAQKLHKDPRVIAWSKHFKIVFVDFKVDRALAKRYGVTSTPRDIFVSADKTPRVYRPDGIPKSANLYAWRFANAWREFHWPHYPKRTAALWTHPPDLTRHLQFYDDAQRQANINHTTEFDPQWVAWLPPLERESLHSDHHSGTTKWEYVVRPPPPRVAKR